MVGITFIDLLPCTLHIQGRSLDPPLRSRFQSRVVDSSTPPPFPLPWSSDSSSSQPVALFAETLRELSKQSTDGGKDTTPPPFPTWVLPHTHRLLNTFPGLGEGAALARVYPYLFGCLQQGQPPQGGQQQQQSQAGGLVADLMRRTGVDDTRVGPSLARVTSLPPSTTADPRRQEQRVLLEFEATVDVRTGRAHPPLQVPAPGGDLEPCNDPLPGVLFVETPTTRAALTAMVQEHALGRDVCLMGGKGVGKSRLAQLFARRLGYGDAGGLEVFPLFKEMTPRDLLQRRATDAEVCVCMCLCLCVF